jgi:eukaryotic-like serine/threonine-protein kinase
MQSAHTLGDIVDNRYRILQELGRGGTGITYLAETLETGQKVALKELSLKGLKDWKQIELFEREARTLEGLDHPAIPDYVDYFQVDKADNRLFYLAQEFAEGTSLADLVETGWRADVAEVRRIAMAVLKVLDYLHRLQPPVVHRDIKPQNIIRREDGHIYLVDFGAVQTIYRDTMSHGSTVVGTYGYMAPEQFRGQAVPATDLYGLGATLLFLLTHQSPADLPQQGLAIDFRPHVAVPPPLADWLEQLLAPLVEDRFASAQDALQALRRPPSTPAPGRPDPRLLDGTRVKLEKTQSQLEVWLPPIGWQPIFVYLGIFILFMAIPILLPTLGMVFHLVFTFSLLPLLFLLPFWAVVLVPLWLLIKTANTKTRLYIDRQNFVLERRALFWKKRITGQTASLVKIDLQFVFAPGESGSNHKQAVHTMALVAGVETHRFGTFLTEPEKVWLAKEVNTFINQLSHNR